MSLTLDQTTHVMANALHRTIANLLQLSFIQLCQQAVSFNSSLKVLGVVCLNVDEGNDIIIKLNDTVERDGDESPVAVNASRADWSGQGKPVAGSVQAFTLPPSNNIDKKHVRASVTGMKKRKWRTNEDEYTLPPKATPTSIVENHVARKIERLTGRNDSTASASHRELSTEENGEELLQSSRSQLAQQTCVSTANAGTGTSPTGTRPSVAVKEERSLPGASCTSDSEPDASRLPFGGFVRTHRVENLPFACAQCAAPFDRASKLREHALATEHLAYQCTVCATKFKSWRNVQRHAVHHLSYKPYGCGVCQKGFSRRDHALKHIQAVHRVVPADTALINVMQLRRSGLQHDADMDASYNEPQAGEAQDLQDVNADVDAEADADDEKPQFHMGEPDAGGGPPFESGSASASASASTATSALARTDAESERELFDTTALCRKPLLSELLHVPTSTRSMMDQTRATAHAASRSALTGGTARPVPNTVFSAGSSSRHEVSQEVSDQSNMLASTLGVAAFGQPLVSRAALHDRQEELVVESDSEDGSLSGD